MGLKMCSQMSKSLCRSSADRILLLLRLLVALPSLALAAALGVMLLMYAGQWSVGRLLMHSVAGVTYAVAPLLPFSVYSRRSCRYAVPACCALVLIYAHRFVPSDFGPGEEVLVRLWISAPLVLVILCAVLAPVASCREATPPPLEGQE